jgi:hypothetical protein
MRAATLLRVALGAVALAATAPGARAQGIAGRLRTKASHALHRGAADTTARADSTPVDSTATSGLAGKAASAALSAAKASPAAMPVKLAKFYGDALVGGLKFEKRYGNTVLGMLDPKSAQEGERALNAAGFTLADVQLGHYDPKAMAVLKPIFDRAAAKSPNGAAGLAEGAKQAAAWGMPAEALAAIPTGAAPNATRPRAATPAAPASGALPPGATADTTISSAMAELQRLQDRATGGDADAAKALVRFQQEMNDAVARLGAGAHPTPGSPEAKALGAEMRRALDCAETGRGCTTHGDAPDLTRPRRRR